jgi:dTMP kinase
VKGRLVTFEGIDGVGKTTHAQRALAYLAEAGFRTSHYREPGGTPLGEELRRLIKDGAAVTPIAELMLFTAARAELVNQRLKPDLSDGRIVVLDRFTDSTLAYQGAFEEISDSVLVSTCLAAAGGLYPDLTFWLDISPEEAVARRYPLLSNNAESLPQPVADAIEKRDLSYYTRVRERYHSIYQSDTERVVQIDASGDVDGTSERIIEVLRDRLARWNSAAAPGGS